MPALITRYPRYLEAPYAMPRVHGAFAIICYAIAPDAHGVFYAIVRCEKEKECRKEKTVSLLLDVRRSPRSFEPPTRQSAP